MTNCKTILVYIGGMLTLATILIGADIYKKYSEGLCFNQQVETIEFKPVEGAE